MFEKIIYISDQGAHVRVNNQSGVSINLMNLHLVFEDKDKQILAEVDDMDGDVVKARFLGEITNGRLVGGVIRKPSLDASVRVIKPEEVPLIVGEARPGNMLFGMSPFYNDTPVYLNVNGFFSNHFVIIGNSGSGKSCGVTRIIQNLFEDQALFPYKSNILLFDSSAEYYNAFKDLNKINPNYNYKFITTNESEGEGERLRIPIFLLNRDDMALLLQATEHSQLPIIERMLKLVHIFNQSGVDAEKFKNHLIAKAVMSILYTNETSPNKRNEIFTILGSCSTEEFNLEAEVSGVGYTRKFRELFIVDSKGHFSESVLLTEYVSGFIKPEYDSYEPSEKVFYTLEDLEKALNFTLISEGWLRNENTYADAVTLKVRLRALIVGPYAKFFEVDQLTNLETFLSSLLINDGKKYQLVNINLDDVDDDFAKVVTKVFTRLAFEFTKKLPDRGSIPFHILVEEAHRYIQDDRDRYLIGYNIFERVAKEGRKYGAILGLITQRPVDLSDTVVSQCSNFLIFKINHPTDVEYIRKMVPNITDEIVAKQKSLQAGTCLGFGQAFKIPLIVKMKMPSPEPSSGNADVINVWNGNPNNHIDTSQPDTMVNPSLEVATESQVNLDSQNFGLPQDVASSEPSVSIGGMDISSPLNIGEQDDATDDGMMPNLMKPTKDMDDLINSVASAPEEDVMPMVEEVRDEAPSLISQIVTDMPEPELPKVEDIAPPVMAMPELGISSALEQQTVAAPENSEAVPSVMSFVQPSITPTVATEKEEEESIKFFNPLTNEEISQ